jgi:CzcA family heavy metal efflux pump
MMRWIVGSGLKFRLLVFPVAAALIVVGLTQVRSVPADVLPEFTAPTVQIQTEALGLSAAEVEQFITVPLEQDLLNGVPWLDTIRSQSVAGLSQVDLVFRSGTDIIKARQVTAERLTQAVALPHVSKAPTMIDPVSSTSRVMVVGLSSKSVSLIDLSVLARWQVKPRLQGLQGVANVSVWGQRERQLQVQVDPQQLANSGVTLNQVIATTGNALWVSPLTFIEASTPGTGGFIESPSQRLTIQHVLPITTAADLAKVPVEDASGKRLGDVAQVVEDHQPLIGDGSVNDAPGLLLVIEKAPGANTLQVTKEVEDALRALQPGLSGVDIDTTVYRPATYIESAIGNIGIALLIGLILLIVLLGGLFLDWRTAIVSLVALPLSAIVAGFVLYLRGSTANTLVLAGLIVALAILVDDAVVDVDHIRRRLAEHRESDEERSTAAVIVEAIREVRGPIVYATLILLVAVAPLFLLGGLAGFFTRPLALSYALAVTASLVVALVVTPAVAVTLFRKVPARRRESPVLGWLHRGHARLVLRWINWPRLTAVAVAVLVAAAPFVLATGSGSLLPRLQDRNLLISWTGTPSTSLAETTRITERAGAELRKVPGVSNVGVHIGRAVTADQVTNVNAGEFWITIKPTADYDATLAKIQNVVNGYPGFNHHVLNYPEQKVSQQLAGTQGDITVRVFGTDLDTLRTKAEEVRALLSHVDGLVAPKLDLPPEQPTIEIEVNLAAAERYGIKPGDVRRSTAALLSGLVAGSLFEEQKVFDVVVLGAPSVRESLTSVQNLLIDTPDGGHVLLKDVANVQIKAEPAVIAHDAVSRRVDITANVSGRSVNAVVADIKDKLAGVNFPVEYHAEVLGGYADKAANRQRTWALVGAAAIAILLLLQAAFGSWRLASLLILILPLAPVGGVLAAIVSGGAISLGSLVGLFAVWALAARNGIQLIKHYQHLEQDDGEPFGVGLVLRGTSERFAPIVKTALATALAVLPLVFLGNIAGLELLHPLAVVVLGGLVTSTLLSLFVIPALYLYVETRNQRRSTDVSGSADHSGSDRVPEDELDHAEPTITQPVG